MLAGVLPPVGHIFEKWRLLDNFIIFLICFVTFEQGSSRGAASGGSDFEKRHLHANFDDFHFLICDFQAGG